MTDAANSRRRVCAPEDRVAEPICRRQPARDRRNPASGFFACAFWVITDEPRARSEHSQHCRGRHIHGCGNHRRGVPERASHEENGEQPRHRAQEQCGDNHWNPRFVRRRDNGRSTLMETPAVCRGGWVTKPESGSGRVLSEVDFDQQPLDGALIGPDMFWIFLLLMRDRLRAPGSAPAGHVEPDGQKPFGPRVSCRSLTPNCAP
jgi:hypothetical protein